MTNLKPGHIPNPPTYSRRVAFTFEEDLPPAVPRFGLTAGHWLTQVKTRLVGSKAVLRLKTYTNPSQGEGGAARQELTNHRPGTKRSGINPFHFPELLRTMLNNNPTQGQNLFSRGFEDKEISRPKTD